MTEVQAEIIEQDMELEIAQGREGHGIEVLDRFEKAIASVETAADARQLIDNMAKLEKLLKAADIWHEKASEYIAMEAEAYCRIAELGIGDEIPHHSRKYKAIKWLEGMNKFERSAYVEQCANECTSILAIYEKVVVEPVRKTDAYYDLHYYRDQVLEKFEHEERVMLSDFEYILDKARKNLSPDIVKGYKDEVRDKLRNRGAHGLGDDKGTYLSIRAAKQSIPEIIGNKTTSIARDIGRLKKVIAENDDDYELYLPVETKSNFVYELTEESAANVMLALCGVGAVDYGERSEISTAKLVASILCKFGFTPCGLVQTLYGYSKQAYEKSGIDPSLAQVDMRDYGFEEVDAA